MYTVCMITDPWCSGRAMSQLSAEKDQCKYRQKRPEEPHELARYSGAELVYPLRKLSKLREWGTLPRSSLSTEFVPPGHP